MSYHDLPYTLSHHFLLALSSLLPLLFTFYSILAVFGGYQFLLYTSSTLFLLATRLFCQLGLCTTFIGTQK